MNIISREEAAGLVDLFDDVLTAQNIRVPSPEDDERDESDTGLYGTVYYALLDEIEWHLTDLLKRHARQIRHDLLKVFEEEGI